MTNVATQFKPGCQAHALRKVHNGGRPPQLVKQVKDELENNPLRLRELIDEIYRLAKHGEPDKVRLAACADYLDRVGFRAPKESTLTIQGMVAIGTPEDYRRAAMLMAADKASEALMLHNGETTQIPALIDGTSQPIIDAVVQEVQDATEQGTES